MHHPFCGGDRVSGLIGRAGRVPRYLSTESSENQFGDHYSHGFLKTARLADDRSTVRAENEIGFVLVVAPAAERDVLDGGQSSPRVGHDVMELQEGALRASVSVLGDECALTAITLRDLALDVPRDVPRRDGGRPKLPIRPGADNTWPRLRGGPELGLLDLLEEQGECAVEDRGRIAVRDLAAEKGLDAPQLIVALLADRELDTIALGRSGLDDRTARRRWRRTDRRRRFARLSVAAHRRQRRRGHERGRWCRRWEFPDRRRDIRSWRQLRDQGLDLPPASARGPGEDGFVVLRRQVRTQHPDGREGHRAGGQQVEDHRKVSAGSSRLDTVAGGVLGEPKHLRAVGEERTVALSGVEGGSGVERGQVGHELDGCVPLVAGEDTDAREKILIRQARGESEDVRVHTLGVSR